MATSVKMSDEDKRRLDRLQGELIIRIGRKVPQQELLSWLLDLGEAEQERVERRPFASMTSREMTHLRALSVRTGTRTREEEIDDVVYGRYR